MGRILSSASFSLEKAVHLEDLLGTAWREVLSVLLGDGAGGGSHRGDCGGATESAHCHTVGLIAQMGPVAVALPAAEDALSGPPQGQPVVLTV